ncbi:MAG: hypothetical protein HEQ16_09505 [Bosea sp.]|nr:hypothetical protein [Bosea sp. (in: a-proteobacteria)]
MSDQFIKSRPTAGAKAEHMKDDAMERTNATVDHVQREASRTAESMARSASEMVDTMSTKLKTVGVDTDVMVSAAKDQASELQRILADEMRAHPMRALGIAAAVGVFVGLMTTR